MYNFIYKNKNIFKISFLILWFSSMFLLYIKLTSNDQVISDSLKNADLSKKQAPIVIFTSLIGNVLLTIVFLVIVYIILRWVFKKLTSNPNESTHLFKSIFYFNLALKFFIFIILSLFFYLFDLDNLTIYNFLIYTILSFVINLYIFSIIKEEKKIILSIAFLLLILI